MSGKRKERTYLCRALLGELARVIVRLRTSDDRIEHMNTHALPRGCGIMYVPRAVLSIRWFESSMPSQAVWSPRGRGLSRRKSATSPGRPQVRLCARCRRMLARRKKAPVVITAVARELVGFIWAIAHSVNPRPIVT